MYLVIGLGGIIGAMLRFLLSKWLLNVAGFFPIGTLCVNLIGCFMLGYLQGLAKKFELPRWLVLGVGTGLIGAFTTFSTFSLEVVEYLEKGYVLLVIIYIIFSAVGGYFLVFSGNFMAEHQKKDV